MAERDQAITRLQAICGVAALPRGLMMRTEQVRDLHRAGMEIGGHTVNHPILLSLTLAEAESEIVEGKRRLEAICDSPVDVFAYPNGITRARLHSEHAKLVEALGFRGAVTTARGVCANWR
jgi:peptidoglycan/xylan/chitin deacetylase (PgdA/CDA1 family)